MPEFNREQKIVILIGVSLILVGIGFLLMQLAGVKAAGAWVPLLAGAITLILAVFTRIPGFTILGCLLSFGGAGLLLYVHMSESGAQNSAEAVFLLCISAGLCSIPLLTRIIDKRVLFWPLFPGAIGLIAGLILLI